MSTPVSGSRCGALRASEAVEPCARSLARLGIRRDTFRRSPRGKKEQLQLKRLKKKKLFLKDEIARIEDQLLPDIIA
jgi:hypothetical protein